MGQSCYLVACNRSGLLSLKKKILGKNMRWLTEL